MTKMNDLDVEQLPEPALEQEAQQRHHGWAAAHPSLATSSLPCSAGLSAICVPPGSQYQLGSESASGACRLPGFVVRPQVRRMLQSSPGFRALPQHEQQEIARNMVRVASYMAIMKACLTVLL